MKEKTKTKGEVIRMAKKNDSQVAVLENAGTTEEGIQEVKKMKRTTSTKTIKALVKMRNRIRFDLAIQRNTVWNDVQKSMLIHSILSDYPIPLVYIQATDDNLLWMIDGKQRFTTVFDFIDNKFPLDFNTPDVLVEREVDVSGEPKLLTEEVKVEGKYFEKLDKDLQDAILDYSLSIVEIRNITPEQIEEMFQRLNAGSPLTPMELTRALSGTDIMTFSTEIGKTKFFSEYAALSKNQRNRYVDHELMMQIMMLMLGRQTDISTKEIKLFTLDLREVGIDQAWKDEFTGIISYMEQAFEKLDEDVEKNRKLRNKVLKKVHIPILFLTAKDMIEVGVKPDEFGKWALEFMMNQRPGSAYTTAAGSSSASLKKVNDRIKLMKESAYAKFGAPAPKPEKAPETPDTSEETAETPENDASQEVAAGVAE